MPALRSVRMKDALEEDALSSELAANQPREAQIGGAGNEALFAGREVEIGAGFRQHAIRDAEKLAAAADGERFDRRDPRLLDIILVLFVV